MPKFSYTTAHLGFDAVCPKPLEHHWVLRAIVAATVTVELVVCRHEIDRIRRRVRIHRERQVHTKKRNINILQGVHLGTSSVSSKM